MERTPISERVKEVASISEVSNSLSVSRPSLYKYMDLYDEGRYEAIPGRVLDFFDDVEKGGASTDGDARERRNDELRIRMIEQKRDAASPSRYAWTSDEVPTMLVVDRDGASVLFRNAVAGGWRASVRVSVTVDGIPSAVARYEADPGMGLVRLAGLPSGPRYQYIAQLDRDGETRVSEPHQFSLRR